MNSHRQQIDALVRRKSVFHLLVLSVLYAASQHFLPRINVCFVVDVVNRMTVLTYIESITAHTRTYK